MIDIFISRPSWIAPEFQEGLKGFLSFLDTHELRPRTLGCTDYPTDSPLDEVISMMNECKGAIVLGYPQIYVTKGKIKDNEKNDFHLPTEWNHIETTLAYINKMPLLVIHHKGIFRGIFDHGAISKFIYEKDLSKPNWFLSEDMTGALKTWKSLVKESKKDTINRPVTMTIESSAKQSIPIGFPIRSGGFKKETESVLVYLFNSSSAEDRTLEALMKRLKCNSQAAMYHLEALTANKLINISGTTRYSAGYTGGYDWVNYYSLTPEGRNYVMSNNLLQIK